MYHSTSKMLTNTISAVFHFIIINHISGGLEAESRANKDKTKFDIA